MYNIKKLNQISSVVYKNLPKESYLVTSHLEDSESDAYLVRSASCHEIDFPERLLAIARAGAGVNNIPLAKCAERGIVVFNTPGANANAVKELVICGMLVASRNVVQASGWVNTLKGSGDKLSELVEKGKKGYVGPEVMGKTLGVIGLGAIGVMVANAAVGLGMNVVGFDPQISVENAWHLSRAIHRAMTLEELLAQSDYITIHIPLLDKTRDFISSPEFSHMKDGVILLNFARGEIVRRSSLLEALESGKVARYVLDFPDDALLGHEKVITTPHLGASTPESEDNCAMMAAAELANYIETGSIHNSVNMPECLLSVPQAHRIALIHRNLPNMVGQMTSIIASAHINISEMANKSRGEIAYTVIDLDSKPGDDVLARLTAIEGVIKLRVIA